MKPLFVKTLLPFSLLGVAALLIFWLVNTRPEAEAIEPERPRPPVRVIPASPTTVQLKVYSQGVVQPRFETRLRPEVGGRIVEINPDFEVGKRVNEGTVLARIDEADLLTALAARRAERANAAQLLAEETARSEQAALDWTRANRSGEPGALTLRLPQLAQAEAALESAEANLAQAERRLEQTKIIAPYTGYIAAREISPGDLVGNAGEPGAVGRLFSAEGAEVRLPVSLREAAWLPFTDASAIAGTAVRFSAEVFGAEQHWQGRILRVEPALDAASRSVVLLANIEDAEIGSGALLRDLFVEAEIAGRVLENAFRLPRIALRGNDRVFVVTADQRLVTRTVEVAQRTPEYVIITGGLSEGDQVCVSPVALFVEGMGVVIEEVL